MRNSVWPSPGVSIHPFMDQEMSSPRLLVTKLVINGPELAPPSKFVTPSVKLKDKGSIAPLKFAPNGPLSRNDPVSAVTPAGSKLPSPVIWDKGFPV